MNSIDKLFAILDQFTMDNSEKAVAVPMFLSTHGNEVLSVLVWSYWEADMERSP